MKKLISIFLILILSVSVTYGAEHEIKWRNDLKGFYIASAKSDSIILSDGLLREICDINLNCISEGRYERIFPVDPNGKLYVTGGYEIIYKSRDEKADNSFTDKMINGGFRITESDEIFEKAKEYCETLGIEYDKNRISIIVTAIYTDTGEKIAEIYPHGFRSAESFDKYYSIIKLTPVYNKENDSYALHNGQEFLTESIFKEASFMYDYFYNYILLKNDNETIIGDIFTGKWKLLNEVDSLIVNRNKGIGFVEKTIEGKYKYYHYDTEPVSNMLFDEYHGEFYASLTFKKGDDYYVFDPEDNKLYQTDEKTKASFWGNYVKEDCGKLGLYNKDGIILIPPLYEHIFPICKNVYYAENEKNEGFLYNQENLILKNLSSNYTNEFYNRHLNYKYITEFKNGIFCVYDVEGNKIYETDKYEVDTNGIDIFVTDRENNRIGKVILKDSNPNVRINGKLLVSDTMPRIKNGRTLVPLRALAEETGFEVSYNEETKEINITNKDKIISFKIGEEKAYKNGEEIILEAPPEIINNRTLVPLRAVSDAFGYDISWNAERRLAEIVIKQE